jgi:hypothetical protein
MYPSPVNENSKRNEANNSGIDNRENKETTRSKRMFEVKAMYERFIEFPKDFVAVFWEISPETNTDTLAVAGLIEQFSRPNWTKSIVVDLCT